MSQSRTRSRYAGRVKVLLTAAAAVAAAASWSTGCSSSAPLIFPDAALSGEEGGAPDATLTESGTADALMPGADAITVDEAGEDVEVDAPPAEPDAPVAADAGADAGDAAQGGLDAAVCTSAVGCALPDICDEVPADPLFGTCVECDTLNAAACGTTLVCDTVAGDRAFDECVQCTSNDSTLCTGATPACDTGEGSANLHTCVQCSSAHPACAAGVCDLNPADSTFDTCLTCLPPESTDAGAPANGCTNPLLPFCTDFNGTTYCGQCSGANATTVCPSQVCTDDGHCVCFPGAGCPTGTSCTSSECQ